MAQTAFDLLWQATDARLETVSVAGGQVRVHRAGSGLPIVCIHGWAVGGRAFANQLTLTQHGFEIIAPDLPGFAGSTPFSKPPTMDNLAQVICDLLDELDLKDVILVGWSMGATIAWRVAASGTQRLAAIVSIDMSPKVAPSQDWAHGLIGGVNAQRTHDAMISMQSDWASYCEIFLNRILAAPAPKVHDALAALAYQATPQTAASAWESLTLDDSRQRLGTITLPALTVHGGASALYREEVGEEIARLMPDCEAVVLSGVGHAPHIELAEAFNTLLLKLSAKIQTQSKHHLIPSDI